MKIDAEVKDLLRQERDEARAQVQTQREALESVVKICNKFWLTDDVYDPDLTSQDREVINIRLIARAALAATEKKP